MQAIMARCRGISAVTLRRDLSRLERLGKLSRTRGGAVGMAVPVAAMPDAAAPGGEPQEFDALILPPVKGQWAHTLRQQVARRRAILIAEIGAAGRRHLPRTAQLRGRPRPRPLRRPRAGHPAIERRGPAGGARRSAQYPRAGRGLRAGFAETFPGDAVLHRVDGRGLLSEVIRQAGDAFAAHPASTSSSASTTTPSSARSTSPSGPASRSPAIRSAARAAASSTSSPPAAR